MTKLEALRILEQVTADVLATRQRHALIARALAVLNEAIQEPVKTVKPK